MVACVNPLAPPRPRILASHHNKPVLNRDASEKVVPETSVSLFMLSLVSLRSENRYRDGDRDRGGWRKGNGRGGAEEGRDRERD